MCRDGATRREWRGSRHAPRRWARRRYAGWSGESGDLPLYPGARCQRPASSRSESHADVYRDRGVDLPGQPRQADVRSRRGGDVRDNRGGGKPRLPCRDDLVYPGGIEDAAINECNTLMSSLIIEFVPVEQTATPTM